MRPDPHRIAAALGAAVVTLALLKVVVWLGEPHPEEWLAHQSCRGQPGPAARAGCEHIQLAATHRRMLAAR